MAQTHTGAPSAPRHAHIEAALADYPHLSSERLDELIGWFRKEASAHDVALLASNETIAVPYRRFRAEHIDPLTSKDLVRALVFAAVVGVAVLLIIWRAL